MGNRASFLLLLIWIAAAPLLLGSVPWYSFQESGGAVRTFFAAGGTYAVFRILGYLALGLLIPGLLARPSESPWSRTGTRMLLLALGLLVLAAIQLVPLPRGLLGIFAPAHARDLDVLLPGGGAFPISTDPGLTARAALRIFLLLAAGLVVFATVRTPRRAWILLGTVVGVASLSALLGIVFPDRILFFSPLEEGVRRLTGTFIYPGTFAAFASAALGIAVVACFSAVAAGRPTSRIAAAVACVVLAFALYRCGSRAGLGAGALAVVVALLLSPGSRRLRFGLIGLVIVAAGVGVLLMWDRFEYLSGAGSRGFADVRLPAWGSTLALFTGRPVFGAGFGAYRTAIHLTQSVNTPNELYFAHSDPLNVLAEGGVVGLLLAAAVVAIGIASALRLARLPERDGSAPAAAAVAGLSAILVMALVDFPLQIPATSLLFVVLLFLGPAQKAPLGEVRPVPGRRRTLAAVVAVTGTALLCLGAIEDLRKTWDHPGALTPGMLAAARGRDLLDADPDAAEAAFREARDLQPFETDTHFALALLAGRRREAEPFRAELRASYHVARGRGRRLFEIGLLASRDPLGTELAKDAFREAAALEEGLYTQALGRVPVAWLPEITPDRAFAWDVAGRKLTAEGRPEDALHAFDRAVALGARGEVLKRLARAFVAVDREADGRARFAELGLAWPLP